MARKKKTRAIVQEFDAYFGAGSLDDWQRLCRDVGLDGDYSSIAQCRKASIPPTSYGLRTVHVNIHDLLDAVKQGRRPQRFRNAAELAAYTVNNGKIYPKKHAKEMGPVKALMRRIL
ncbi:hypothetical protein NEMBOFW57_003045 [Staphylotrichum longicolle]|uniref:Uncharacterized protein n=1 Tax=Staphylotrichum longicolle TaxID=669026 RepID=A0AAD4F5G1_9PEZI|nr:hypothetical protein NEMBOFW57_003045 [Staphylotrichum longicolle]